MNEIDHLTQMLLKFRDERDWEQFHNPKDLALAISVEAGELLELFLWKSYNDADKNKVREELADILSYCLLLAEKYQLNIIDLITDKVEQNKLRYPVDKARGTSKKYNELT